MLDGTLIRERVDNIYTKIKILRMDLKNLQDKCEHVIMETWQLPNGLTEKRCKFCDKVLVKEEK